MLFEETNYNLIYKMKFWRICAAAALSLSMLAACSKQQIRFDGGNAIVIDPTVSRATEMSFESGDRIGVTITRGSEASNYISNGEFTSNGSVFRGNGTAWYSGTQNASIRAYYPYSANGEPTLFTVKSDQRGSGYTLSDFMTAAKSGVAPTSSAVSMIFRHKLVKINIIIDNRTSGSITDVGIQSCSTTAAVDVAAESAEPYASSSKADITAHETVPGSEYNAIIAPQRAALTFYARLDDGSEMRTARMTEAEFGSGRQFTAHLTLTDKSFDAQISGEIENWGDNTDLTPDTDGDDDNKGGNTGDGGGSEDGPDNPKEDPSGGTGGTEGNGSVNWGGVDYPTVTLKDGRTWMAANLRYIPAGKSASSDPKDGNGIWYPCNNKTAATDDESVKQYGYLYSPETAHGGTLNDGSSAVRGICPDGWHLPTKAEFDSLKSTYNNDDVSIISALSLVNSGVINMGMAYSNDPISLWGSEVESEAYCFRIVIKTHSIDYYSGYVGASVRCVRDN